MKTIRELRDDVIQTRKDMKTGTIDLRMAQELDNNAGKIVKTTLVQLEYAKLRKEIPTVDFLKCH